MTSGTPTTCQAQYHCSAPIILNLHNSPLSSISALFCRVLACEFPEVTQAVRGQVRSRTSWFPSETCALSGIHVPPF